MSQDPRFRPIGRVYNPELAMEQQQANDRIRSRLVDFGSLVPAGLTRAVMTASYSQQDARSCFYAGLIGVSGGMFPDQQLPDENAIVAASEQEGLIGQYGAETFVEYQQRQVDFVRRYMGLDIEFPQLHPRDRAHEVEALTQGIAGRGNPVLFGLPRHWVVLDGFSKRDDGSYGWVGMNPAGGQRINLGVDTMYGRLLARDMPVVVINNPRALVFRGHRRTPPNPRFQGRLVLPSEIRFQPAQKPRFRPHKD